MPALHHIQFALPSGREDEARAFYAGVLGLVEMDKPPELRARGGAWFRSGALELHLGVEEPFAPAHKAHPASSWTTPPSSTPWPRGSPPPARRSSPTTPFRVAAASTPTTASAAADRSSSHARRLTRLRLSTGHGPTPNLESSPMASVPHMSAQLDIDDDVVLLVPEEETVPEHDVHRVLVDLLAAGLVAGFAEDADVAVFSRLAWFPDRDDTRIRLDPDVMVVFGRPPGPRKSYKAWMEDGVAPAVVVEVWSEDDTDADYRRRLSRMRRYGVAEVVIVDPFAPGGVRVQHLQADGGGGDGYRTVVTSAGPDQLVTVASLGITLSGGEQLDVRGEADEPWPTTAEAFRRARAEKNRADREARRADIEARRANDASRRADEEARRADDADRRAALLAARLRAAGIDPDS